MIVNGGEIQRSKVTSIEVVFSQGVSNLATVAVLRINPEDEVIVPRATSLAWSADRLSGTWTFPDEVGQSLPGGNFEISISSSQIVNDAGESLDGDSDGISGGDFSLPLFRHFGDSDGDRDVDFLDASRFRDALNTAEGDVSYVAAFDFDGDGGIGSLDLAEFRENYLSYLPLIPAVPVVNSIVDQTNEGELVVNGIAESETLVRIVNAGTTVEVVADNAGSFSALVPLRPNGINAIAISAVGQGNVASPVVPISVTQDSTGPTLTIEHPVGNLVTHSDRINVFGSVSDLLSGFEGLEVNVAVNNGEERAASIDREIGTNGRFELSGIPVEIGVNTISVIARDRLGNRTGRSVSISRSDQAPRIVVVSGDEQTARRNRPLEKPLIVQVFEEDGAPLVGQIVTFKRVRGDGRLLSEEERGNNGSLVQALTDSEGIASAEFVLGSNAGVLNNWVEVTSVDVSGEVIFRASSEPNPPSQINISGGEGQRGEVLGRALEPLGVWVSDGLNGVPNVPVVFQAIRGLGRVHGERIFTVVTDSTGHVEVPFEFGPSAGINLVEANFSSNTNDSVVFNLLGLERFVNQPTTFVGIVLDNSNLPIGGATVTVESGGRSSLPVVSNENGVFELSGIVPGAAQLRVRGQTADLLNGKPIIQGTSSRFPDLVYQVNVVANAKNSLPTPVLLPTLNPANEVIYDGTKDVSLTVEGIDGVEFEIVAGSVVLEDGSIPSPSDPLTISLNQVHIDNLPMPLPDGTASLFAWTLQPPNMHMDPPARVELPNMSALAPGAQANILSFDHATERFEVVANARVSEDGAFVRSLDGEGLSVSGWGGICPPYTIDGDVGSDGNDGGPDGLNPVEDTEDCPNPSFSNNDACPVCDSTGKPVVYGTGEEVLTVEDLRIPGRGMDFVWRRTYRSRYDYNGPLGFNWDISYNERLEIMENGDVKRLNGMARVDYYRLDHGAGGYVSPGGFFDVLKANTDGSYTLRDPTGSKTHFDRVGRMTTKEDRNGNRIQFEYEDNRLRTITDTLGRNIEVFFNSAGRIERIRDFTGRELLYTYNGFGDLVQVRSPVVIGTSTANDFPEGKITRYSYLSGYSEGLEALNHNLSSITDAKGQRYLVNRYGTDPDSFEYDRVVLQQWGDQEQKTSFHYKELNPQIAEVTPDTPKVKTTIIDRKGNKRVVISNSVARVIEEQVFTNRNVNPNDPDVFITRRTYNRDGLLISQVFPEGNSEVYIYDALNPDRSMQLNLLKITRIAGPRGGDQSELTRSFTYEPIYNQIATITEERGNDLNYVPQNGGRQNAERYSERFFFDYQEGSNIAALALETGISEEVLAAKLEGARIALNLGDLNEDGITNQVNGNLIRNEKPSVTLIDGSTQKIGSDYSYNRFGQIVSETDPEGYLIEYVYHHENIPHGDRGSIVEISNSTGGYLAATIEDSRMTSRRDPELPLLKIRNEYFYDHVGNVIEAVDGRGNNTLYEVNALNQIIRKSLELPFRYEKVHYYDANDNLIRKDVENVDANGPGLETDSNPFVTTTYRYDVLNFVVEEREEVSLSEFITTRYEYDNNQNLEKLVKPEGNVIHTIYDERDLVYSVTRGFGTPDASTSSRTYDGSRNAIVSVDAEDNNGDGTPETTRMEYDGFDRLRSILDAEGNRRNYYYDPVGNLAREEVLGPNEGPSRLNNTESGNALLSRRECSFDELSRRYQCDDLLFANLTTVGPEGPLSPGDGYVTVRYQFDHNSRMLGETDDNANATKFFYDGRNRLIRVEDAVGNLESNVFDENDNLVAMIETDVSPEGLVPNEIFTTRYEYDSLDRRTKATNNLQNETVYEYDSRDNLVLIVDPLGNTTTQVWDGLNRKIETIRHLRVGGVGAGAIDTSNPSNPDGMIVRKATWDGNSRLISETDDNGNTTTYSYDALDRRIIETFADGTKRLTLYDRDDNAVQHVDQNGSVSRVTFDGLNRTLRREVIRAEGVLGTTEQVFEYDGLSRLTYCSDNNSPENPDDDSIVRLRYDSLSRTLEDIQNGKRVVSDYDGVGRMLRNEYPNGRVVEREHDAIDRVTLIRDQGAQIPISEYNYLGVSRVLLQTFANGVRRTYYDDDGTQVGYDKLRRELRRRYENAEGALVVGLDYGYDKMNNRRFEIDRLTGIGKTYDYDSAYRLERVRGEIQLEELVQLYNNSVTNSDTQNIGVIHEEWQLDGVGNWVNYSRDEEQFSIASNRVNEFEEFDGSKQSYDNNGNLYGDGQFLYTHDSLNRLVLIENEGEIIAEYSYDALGRRTAKTLASGKVHFVYSDFTCLEERNGQDIVLRQFVPGIGVNKPLQIVSGGSRNYYISDSLGSVVSIAGQGGRILERYGYTAYGDAKLYDDSQNDTIKENITNPYRYVGGRFDQEVGLYYSRARFYSPRKGRFLERDPLGYAGGMGLYIYCKNNPINHVDPFGLLANVHLVFGGGGALVWMGGQLFADGVESFHRGEVVLSDWEEYVGAGIGGATQGLLLLNGKMSTVQSGLVAGAVGNLAKQFLRNEFGEDCGYDLSNFALETGVAGLTGLLPSGRVPGLSSGRGSANQVFKQVMTKAKNGTISKVELRTALKMFAGQASENRLVAGSFGGSLLTGVAVPVASNWANSAEVDREGQ